MNFTLMFAVCTIIALSGCKYEDGPGLSLRSKKARVAATWEFKKVRYNHFDSTSEYGDYTWEMRKDGTFYMDSKGRQPYNIFGGKARVISNDFDIGVEQIDRFLCRINFTVTDAINVMQNLTLQVAGINIIHVHNADGSHTSGRKVQRCG